VPEQQELYRLGVKCYFKRAPGLDLAAAVKLFHAWIQNACLPGLLIDVADYRHVESGPGVLIIAYEGNYGLSVSGSRPVFEYYQKRPGGLNLEARWLLACRNALQGAQQLCEETGLGVGLELDSSRLCLFTHDRLLAPNSSATAEALKPVIGSLLGKLYAGAPYSVRLQDAASDPFALHVRDAPVMNAAVLLASIAD